jgi:hypothetical protein
MATRTVRLLQGVAAVAMLAGAMGCSDNPAGPSGGGATVAGTWFGTANFPNGFGARMTLQQNSNAVTGIMTLSGTYVDQPLTGTYAPGTRTFNWAVNDGCERWSGQLTLDAAGSRLTGTIALDGRGCVPQVVDESGTLTIDKQ